MALELRSALHPAFDSCTACGALHWSGFARTVALDLRPRPGQRGCPRPFGNHGQGFHPLEPTPSEFTTRGAHARMGGRTKGSPAVELSGQARLRYPLAKAMRLRRGAQEPKRKAAAISVGQKSLEAIRTTHSFEQSRRGSGAPVAKRGREPEILAFPVHGAPCCDPDRAGHGCVRFHRKVADREWWQDA
jgi:hypothetical protein